MARARSKNSASSSADFGFEAKLWLAPDKLRSKMDAGEYKHVVLGLIFLKYVSDTFEEHHAKLVAGIWLLARNAPRHRSTSTLKIDGISQTARRTND